MENETLFITCPYDNQPCREVWCTPTWCLSKDYDEYLKEHPSEETPHGN